MGFRIPDLAPTPPRGWNSFDSYGIYLDESAALANMRVQAERLLPFGYRYFVVDMGWYSQYPTAALGRYPQSGESPLLQIDEFGRYVPATNIFPRGIRFLAQRAHALGLKFGLHLMRGIPRLAVERNLPVEGTSARARDVADRSSVCSWNDYNYGLDHRRPEARAYYESVVRLLASWEVDFLKADDIVPYPEEITALAEAIEAQDRPLVLSLSPGNTVDYGHLSSYQRANMVRLTRDVWDRRVCLDRCFAAWQDFQDNRASGFWPDLDMIPLGHLRLCLPPENLTPGARLPSEGLERWCQWTPDQQKTFITMLALASSPLFFGGDLLSAPEEVFSLLTQPEILACNDKGVVGHKVWSHEQIEIWKSERNVGVGGWVGVFNRSQECRQVELTTHKLGCSDTMPFAQEVWTGSPIPLPGVTSLAPDGVAFFAIGE